MCHHYPEALRYTYHYSDKTTMNEDKKKSLQKLKAREIDDEEYYKSSTIIENRPGSKTILSDLKI